MSQKVDKELHSLFSSSHGNPHALLGLQVNEQGEKVIRLYRPGAKEIYLYIQGELVSPTLVDEVGLFHAHCPPTLQLKEYQIYHQNGLLAHDPYSFEPCWGEIDSYLFRQGTHYELFEKMGAHKITHQGVEGVLFTVWAPNAKSVSLVGDFNFWDGRVNPMRSMEPGIWELFVPGVTYGERYKYEIHTKQGEIFLKTDPYGFAQEMRPLNASVVAKVENYSWEDEAWENQKRLPVDTNTPLNIYEVHLGSWKKPHEHFLNYRDLAHELSAYCKEMGFTHVELLPIQEHPLDESWGYQVSGFFAVTSRFGSPEDFQYFVNHMHKQGIGVILDWVPGHFPTDDFTLGRFDGTALYEHADPRQGYHPHWNTLIFNYGRHEVSNFLLASALFWIEKMHIDGLRVDAVASMLYLDYGRENGEWIPNQYGGKENLDAIEFLKHLNSIVHQKVPGILMIAEESTSFPGVTKPVDWEGLGFDFKWNMGWMNDTLRYFHTDPLFRKSHHQDLTFGLLYAFSENFLLPLSHDEVVHGKKSLLSKMPGDTWQKFASLRLLLSYQICQPGKKLLFMGAELGQWEEWKVKRELDWHLLQYPVHNGIHRFVKELNHFYLKNPAFWENDTSYEGFEWVDFSDELNSVICYLRKGKEGEPEFLCLHNFTPQFHEAYQIPLQGVKKIEELFNSDCEKYGGSNQLNGVIESGEFGFQVKMAPLSTQIFMLI
jgi:1,4-alpha-glucan branching enzyme